MHASQEYEPDTQTRSHGAFRRGRGGFIALCVVIIGAAIFGLYELTARVPQLTVSPVQYSYATLSDRALQVPVGSSLSIAFTAAHDRLDSMTMLLRPVTAQATGGTVRATLWDSRQNAIAQAQWSAAEWYAAQAQTLPVHQTMRVGEAYTLTVSLTDAAGELAFALIDGPGYPTPTQTGAPQVALALTYATFQRAQLTNIVLSAAILLALLLLLVVFPWFASPRGMEHTDWGWMLIAPFFLLATLEWMQPGAGMFGYIGGWLSVLAYAAMMWLLTALFGRSRFAQILVALVWFVPALVSVLETQILGRPLLPWDVFAAYTTGNVIGGYHFAWTWQIAVGFVALTMFIIISLRHPIRWRFSPLRLVALLLSATVLYATVWVLWDGRVFGGTDNDRTWDAKTFYTQQSFTAALIHNTKKLIIPAPAGYAPDQVATIVASALPAAELPKMAAAPTNIIVIMNESFADLQSVFPFVTNQPVLPQYTAVSQGTMHGTLQVSVIGGGTCTTEFEMLTGNSAMFMPPDSTAFVQYLLPGRNNAYSLASSLKAQGYQTVALHPADPKNWNRASVYPLMGFDRFLSLADMPVQDVRDKDTHVRYVYRDDALYAELGKLVTGKPAGSKLFVHCVTMQNHGGYADNPPLIDLTTSRTDAQPNAQVDTYLSLMRLSDDALGGLIAQAKTWAEPTLILFFGDHQPKFVDAAGKPDDLSGGLEKGTLAEHMRFYEVPFMFWSNQPLPAQALGTVSPNYLGGMLMQIAGLPSSGYQQYVAGLRTLWPVLTTQGARDARGQLWAPDQAMQTALPLKQYQMVQYNLMFDQQGKQTVLFQ